MVFHVTFPAAVVCEITDCLGFLQKQINKFALLVPAQSEGWESVRIWYHTMSWKTNKHIFANQERPAGAYFGKAFDFISAWLGGQQEFILHTSGSTGVPKPISVTRAQMIASARMTGVALGIGEGIKALVCLNVNYIAGIMMLVRGMELDWELTIVEPASNPFADIPQDENFDFIAMVPLQLATCLDTSILSEKIAATGRILLGGAPVSMAMEKDIRALQTPVYQSYGMTETVSHVALRRLNGAEKTADYTFLPNLHFGTDERGCLYVSGAVTNGHLVQTNDIVDISGNRFKWIGRADNVINSGGVKIVLDHIDRVFAEIWSELGSSRPYFSWYEPDDRMGQKLILVVEGKPDPDLEESILDLARHKLSAYEVPKHIYFVPEFIKTATDKIDKRLTFNHISKF